MGMRELPEKQRKAIMSLQRKKGRLEWNQFLIEGLRSVEAAVLGGAPLESLLIAHRHLDVPHVRRLVEHAVVPIFTLSEKAARSIAATDTNQGIFAVARIELLPGETLDAKRSVLVLDGIQDPGNVGTLIRSAAWFGVEAVLTGLGTADVYSPKVVRASMGGIWDLALYASDDLEGRLQQLKSHGFSLFGADMEGMPAESWSPSGATALVIGSEAHGISQNVKSLLDEQVTITGVPGSKATESLNAATAAAILMHRWKLI